MDEPKLPVIPQFVADWIEEFDGNRSDLFRFILRYQWNKDADSDGISDEIIDWIFETDENILLTLKLIKNDTSYTIEKEPLYDVVDKDGRSLLYFYSYNNDTYQWRKVVSYGNYNDGDGADYKKLEKEGNGKLSHGLTESQIKEYDERFWAFAEVL